MVDVHCPSCGYNLTGLPENRCPECGEPFEPSALGRGDVRAYTPISLAEALWRLLWPPALCALSGLGGCLVVPVFGWLMIYGLLNAWNISHRIAVTRQWGSGGTGRAGRSGWRLELCCVALLLLQLLTGIVGAGLVLWIVRALPG